jgi:hypothetical protein
MSSQEFAALIKDNAFFILHEDIPVLQSAFDRGDVKVLKRFIIELGKELKNADSGARVTKEGFSTLLCEWEEGKFDELYEDFVKFCKEKVREDMRVQGFAFNHTDTGKLWGVEEKWFEEWKNNRI